MRGISVTRTGSMRSVSLFAAAITIAFGLAGCGTVDNALFGSGQDTEAATAPAPQPGGMPGTLPGSDGGMGAAPASYQQRR